MGNETGGDVECTEVMPADAAPPQLLLNHGLCGDASMVHARHPQRGPPAHAVPPGQRVLHEHLCSQKSQRLIIPMRRQPLIGHRENNLHSSLCKRWLGA